MNSRARIPGIDALKGAAILGVLFVHMAFSARFDAATLGHIRLLQDVFAWCVLAFFFASGLLHGLNDTARGIRDFATRRAIRLLIPCAAFTWMNKLLLLAAKAGGFLASDAAPAPEGLRAVLEFIFIPAAPQFYFLAHLFAIAVVAHVLLRLRLTGNGFAPWLLAALLLQAYWFLPLEKPHGEALTQLPLYGALYLAGIGFAQAGKSPRAITGAGAAVFLIAVAAVATHRVPAIDAAIPPALALLFSVVPAGILAPLAWLGKRSGAIYAWHAPLLMPVLSIILVKLHLAGWPLIAAMSILTAAASLAVAAVVRRFDRHKILSL